MENNRSRTSNSSIKPQKKRRAPDREPVLSVCQEPRIDSGSTRTLRREMSRYSNGVPSTKVLPYLNQLIFMEPITCPSPS